MNKIENFEAACAITGNDPKKEYSKQDRLEIMIKAINNNIPPNWADSSERKFYPWFDVIKDASKPTGFGLSNFGYDYSCTYTNVGSRLTFRELDGLKYMVENHIGYYEEVYL